MKRSRSVGDVSSVRALAAAAAKKARRDSARLFTARDLEFARADDERERGAKPVPVFGGATAGRNVHALVAAQPRLNVTQYVTEDDILRVDPSPDMRLLLERAGIFDVSPVSDPTPRKSYELAVSSFLERRPLTTLWPSQIEAADFMASTECDRPLGAGGGIIADEMGQGKTLEVLYYILCCLQTRCENKGHPTGAPTLVVVPKTLLLPWMNEIAKHFPANTFSLLVLAGAATAGAPPLPPVALNARYVSDHVTLVLVTYPVLVSAFSAHGQSTGGGGGGEAPAFLFDVSWERVIGDEGHLFANVDTTRFKAMCALRAHHKWILTGTPVLNDVSNVYAELRFIGVDERHLPSALRARNERVPGTIAATRSRLAIASGTASATDGLVALLAVREMLAKIMLRRVDSRDRYTRRVELSEFQSAAERVLYQHYDARFNETCRATLEQRDARSGQLMVMVDILRLRQICVAPTVIPDLDLPPSLLLDGGFSVARRAAANTQARVLAHARVPTLGYLCAAAVLTRRPPLLTLVPDDMRWIWDRVGIERWRVIVPTSVHLDRLEANVKHVRSRLVPTYGTKTRVFLANYREVIAPAPGDKYLIFSDFVNVLENIAAAFAAGGVATLMLSGSQSPGMREAVLREFEQSPDVRVMLISLSVGATGLNIACANHVSLADPWWNPQTEMQSIYRILRPDQTKYGRVYNVIMNATVEEDVMRMAEEKNYIARILLDSDADTLRIIERLRARDGHVEQQRACAALESVQKKQGHVQALRGDLEAREAEEEEDEG